ncbi:hypothetical protein QBC36DRAFT_327398 [Triangularia setosa]|uniref:Uncharacterized protein n=1 Tax=Triangularia setosa TaxID=2587417 RepID=A0AAN7A8Q6_9PEZI|nr:hypothetical protein QBC36DRAFT_327398 [Podospora setosa]
MRSAVAAHPWSQGCGSWLDLGCWRPLATNRDAQRKRRQVPEVSERFARFLQRLQGLSLSWSGSLATIRAVCMMCCTTCISRTEALVNNHDTPSSWPMAESASAFGLATSLGSWDWRATGVVGRFAADETPVSVTLREKAPFALPMHHQPTTYLDSRCQPATQPKHPYSFRSPLLFSLLLSRVRLLFCIRSGDERRGAWQCAHNT